MTTNPNVYYGKRRKVPFELGRGHFVCHDLTLQPKHRKIGWEARCAACWAAWAYVQQVDATMYLKSQSRQPFPRLPSPSMVPPQTPAMPTGRVKAHVSSLVGA